MSSKPISLLFDIGRRHRWDVPPCLRAKNGRGPCIYLDDSENRLGIFSTGPTGRAYKHRCTAWDDQSTGLLVSSNEVRPEWAKYVVIESDLTVLKTWDLIDCQLYCLPRSSVGYDFNSCGAALSSQFISFYNHGESFNSDLRLHGLQSNVKRTAEWSSGVVTAALALRQPEWYAHWSGGPVDFATGNLLPMSGMQWASRAIPVHSFTKMAQALAYEVHRLGAGSPVAFSSQSWLATLVPSLSATNHDCELNAADKWCLEIWYSQGLWLSTDGQMLDNLRRRSLLLLSNQPGKSTTLCASPSAYLPWSLSTIDSRGGKHGRTNVIGSYREARKVCVLQRHTHTCV
jgi:hypothetical protein